MRPGEENNGFFRGSSTTLTGTNISRDTRPALVHPTLFAAPDVSPDAAAGAGAYAGAGGGDEDMDQEFSGTESAESVRGRRCSGRGARISEQAAFPPWTATPGPKRAVLLATSGADPGTEAAGDAQDRIGFKGFRTRGEGAKETGDKEREGRNTAPAADAAAAEARTPPAMERNLFLSALANGRIEVMEMHLPHTTSRGMLLVVP